MGSIEPMGEKRANTAYDPLTMGTVFRFWLPLAAMWLMMGIEHPLITAVIARLPNSELNLAAFGISFSLALIIESPIIMLLTAATALAHDRRDYGLLLRFTHLLSGALTALHLLLVLTPLYGLIVDNLIGAPAEIIEPSRKAFLFMTPWTAGIAYRRLWQGVLIRYKRTKVIPITMISRLLMSIIVLAVGFLFSISGSAVGAIALSSGVIAAAAAAYGFSRSVTRYLMPGELEGRAPLSWKKFLEFYIPLALTSLIIQVGQPVIAMGLARAPHPLVSLAVWPVIMGALFIIRSLGLSYQEVVVALLGEKSGYRVLKRFTWVLAFCLSGSLALIAFTPLSRWWFTRIAGLSPKLVAFSIIPVMILSFIPGSSGAYKPH